MVLKAVLFDFNGVILDDEPIHETLINDLLISENLRPQPNDFNTYCLGRSDKACLTGVLGSRGRQVSDNYLNQLIQKKAIAYADRLRQIEKLPLFEGVATLIESLHQANLKIGVVSGALRDEIITVLQREGLADKISTIVGADDTPESKPNPGGYLQAVRNLNLSPQECLVLEDTFIGIQAAKAAKIPVVGVAHTLPFHMLQRCTNWTVDYLSELEIGRIQAVYAGEKYPTEIPVA